MAPDQRYLPASTETPVPSEPDDELLETEQPRDGRFVKGFDPRRGHGPEPGAPNAGRPPDALKRQVEEILASPECMSTLETILKRGGQVDARLWAKVWSAAMDKVVPRPQQQILIDGDVAHWAIALPATQPSVADWIAQYAPQLPGGASKPDSEESP